MLLNLYSVLDSTSRLYLPPFPMRTDKEAIEAFTSAINAPDSIWKKYPEDYLLMRISTFDDETGIVDPQQPQVVISAQKVLNPDYPV